MAYHGVPVVKINLERMETTLVAMIAEHEVLLDGQVRAAVKAAVESFDYAGEVRKLTNQLITNSIRLALQRELEYGPGYEVIAEVARKFVRAGIEREAKRG